MQPLRYYYEKVAFIKEMRRHPALWNINHEKYNDRFFMASAWRVISHKMHMPETVLKSSWKNLRDIFSREMKKYYSNSTKEYKGKWKYFQKMAYLIENFVEETDSYNDDDDYPIEFIVENESDHSSEEMPDDDDANRVAINKIKKETRLVEYDDVQKGITQTNQYDDEDSKVPVKQKSTDNINYDVMFLKSLAPFFKQLDPLRKLVMRSKIQDLLLKEIADQNSCSSET